jgi:hypothetical protein
MKRPRSRGRWHQPACRRASESRADEASPAFRGRLYRRWAALQSRPWPQKGPRGSLRWSARSGAIPARHRPDANVSRTGSAAARGGRRRSSTTRIGPGARLPARPVAGQRAPAGSMTWAPRRSLRRGVPLRSPACAGRFDPRRPAACQQRVLWARQEYRSASESARGDFSNPLRVERRLDDRCRSPLVTCARHGRRSATPAAEPRDATDGGEGDGERAGLGGGPG